MEGITEEKKKNRSRCNRARNKTIFSNLDEFFEIRVAGIKQQIESETAKSGRTHVATKRSTRFSAWCMSCVGTRYDLWNKELVPALAKNGIRAARCRAADRKTRGLGKALFPGRSFPDAHAAGG